MIEVRHPQRTFGEGLIHEAVEDLWEPWMRHADQALEDEALLLLIQQELMKRCKKSKTRGRKATSVEVVLRMMLLKHVRNWSFEVLSREVRANLVYRDFTRIGAEKVPDDKTMGNLARQLSPKLVDKLHERMVGIAVENKIVTGQKMRVDTTVVETNIHYPTDSTLMGDGVRVLTRVMKKVTEVAGQVGTRMRNRSRSVKLKVLAIARACRNKTKAGQEKMKEAYLKLIDLTSRVVGDAKKFAREIADGTKKGNRKVLRNAKKQLDQMAGPDTRGREPDCYALSSLRPTACRQYPAGLRCGQACGTIWSRPTVGSGRSGILFRRQRSPGRGTGGAARFHSQPWDQEQVSQGAAEEALVQATSKMAYRL